MRKFATVFILFPIIVFLLNGCTDSVEDGLPGKVENTTTNSAYHPSGWKDNPQHGIDYSTNPQNCKACHGNDLQGGSSGVSCGGCHHSGWIGTHGEEYAADPDNCKACHGADLTGGLIAPSCAGCHHDWSGSHADEDLNTCQACHGSITTCADCHHSGWTGTHGEEYAADPDNCKTCHGDDLNGEGDQNRDCGYCHHEEAVAPWQHGDYHTLPDTDNCTNCHGAGFSGANSLVSCFSCHSAISAFDCGDCHTSAATPYTDSAHGNTSYGVDRSGTGTGGDCTHCHDLPAGSTNDLLLFAPMNQTSQTNNFCFQCHKDTGDSPVQIGMPQQRSYSYRAGGWTPDPLDDVKEAFSSTSSHNLGNILTFITGKWGHTASSNPCDACHNPHAAQRDPHTEGNRGWPVTLPSKHGSSVAGEQLWGDDAGEKMSDYTAFYQAPYRFEGVGNGYEPDGSAITTNGSNLACYATFCQDCHTSTMSDYGLTHTGIDWTTTGGESGGDKHGMNPATGNVHYLNAPYAGAWTASGLVLSCTDCHEPHGAPNEMLIRGEVNGGQVTIGTIGTDDVDLKELCLRCHQNNWSIHHQSGNPDAPYNDAGACNDCHASGWNTGPTSICSNCHFHGGDDSWLLTAPTITNGNIHYTGRRTF